MASRRAVPACQRTSRIGALACWHNAPRLCAGRRALLNAACCLSDLAVLLKPCHSPCMRAPSPPSGHCSSYTAQLQAVHISLSLWSTLRLSVVAVLHPTTSSRSTARLQCSAAALTALGASCMLPQPSPTDYTYIPTVFLHIYSWNMYIYYLIQYVYMSLHSASPREQCLQTVFTAAATQTRSLRYHRGSKGAISGSCGSCLCVYTAVRHTRPTVTCASTSGSLSNTTCRTSCCSWSMATERF